MRTDHRLIPAWTAAALILAGCGERNSNEAAATPPQGQVTQLEATPPAPVAPAPAPPTETPIQTQTGSNGATVALTRAAVTGDVLTVQLAYSGKDSGYNPVNIKLDEVSVIDDVTAQRYGVLKDAGGQWLAAPLNADKTGIYFSAKAAPTTVWFKFPAPPATSPSVSINIPNVGPFDGVQVRR